MKHTDWKWFLIKRFLLILILVGISERLLNGIYDKMIFPWLSDTMHIQFFAAGLEDGQPIGTLLKGMVYLAVRGMCNQLPEIIGLGLRGFCEQWAGSSMTGWITSQTAHMSRGQEQFYILGMAALTLLILLTLVLPYVIAAFVFSQLVENQIRRMEEQERQQKEEYDRRRNLLLSDVAHDLKTPMTAVAGYARALVEDAVSGEKRQEYLETIYNKSMQMSGLLNLLFEYVKLDSEGFQLKETRENLSELLRECAAELYMDFEEKDMEMLPEIPEEELWVSVDRVQFQRVIHNLLNNAIRHNPRGTSVWVMAEQEEEHMVVRVCDNGAAISKETARYIFDPFVMGDESRNSKGGSGLGLSIAQKVIAMHGGSLKLEQGSTAEYTKAFVIRLPRQETEEDI